MVLPYADINVLDGGLGLGPSPVTAVAVIACSSQGTAEAAPLITNDATLIKDTFGQGPLVDAGACLVAAGVTAVLVKATTSTVGAAGSVTTTRVDSSDGTVTVEAASEPNDAYEVEIEITTSTDSVEDNDGAFRYSLDGGDSWSDPIAIPVGSGGPPATCDYAIPNTNVTVTFTDGAGTELAFEDGDTFTFDCTAPAFSTTGLADAYAVLVDDPQLWRFLWIPQEADGAAASATLAATAKALIEGSTVQKRYAHVIMGAKPASGEDDADIKSAFATFESRRVTNCAGDTNFLSASNPGKFYRRNLSWEAALRAATVPASEDIGRVKSGGLARTAVRANGSPGIYRDEYKTPGLDAERFVTSRTIPGVTGYHITQGLSHAPSGSDFKLLSNCFVMDICCTVLAAGLARYINDDLRVDDAGDLDGRDANAIQSELEEKLRDAVIRSTPQHVSNLRVQVIRNNSPLSTQTLKAKFSILPKAYFKYIDGEITFVRELAA